MYAHEILERKEEKLVCFNYFEDSVPKSNYANLPPVEFVRVGWLHLCGRLCKEGKEERCRCALGPTCSFLFNRLSFLFFFLIQTNYFSLSILFFETFCGFCGGKNFCWFCYVRVLHSQLNSWRFCGCVREFFFFFRSQSTTSKSFLACSRRASRK